MKFECECGTHGFSCFIQANCISCGKPLETQKENNMQVIDFIRNNSVTNDLREGLEKLTTQLGISVKYVDDLIVLNYNQIESPKTHPIVMECRSLILEAKTLKVVSRSFDRFFNYGEALNVTPEIDWSRAVAYEKVDGSLIKIYNHKGKWYISTKGTAYGESDCMGHGITFAELVYKALGCKNDQEFQELCKGSDLWEGFTYIYELTSFENRVVRRYDGYALHLLAVRANEDGRYVTATEMDTGMMLASDVPDAIIFGSVEECLKAAANLKNLDEGYVIYQDGVPVAKVKSPAYVAVHHIRGEGLSPKRIMQLVLSGEEDEYLNYFPEDKVHFEKYSMAYCHMMNDIILTYEYARKIDGQKEFAQAIASKPFKAALFQARARKIEADNAFNEQRVSYKMEILEKYVK